MDFEFKGIIIYVSESDLEAMVYLCEEGETPKEAFHDITFDWDEVNWYICDEIEDQVCAELARRLAERN